MFNRKKILCVASAMLIALPTMLTGCNGSKTSSASSTAASSAASTASSETKAPVTLSVWLAGDSQKGMSRIDTAINTYLKSKGSNISVDVKMMGWGTDFEQKATTMFTSGGSDADVLFTSNWVDKYRQNANNGYFVDLASYLKTDKGQEIVKILGQDFLNGSKLKGTNFALPCNKEKVHDWGFLVRTDLFKKYNMTASSIKSLSDMEPYFAKAKADGVIALDIAAFDSPWHFLDWDMVSDDGIPAAINDTTNKIVDPFTDPTSVALYKTLKGYADKGYISKDATTSKGIDADLKTGKYFCGVDSLKPGKDKEESQSVGVDYTQIDITPIVKSNRETTGSMLAINKFSKNQDAAFDLIYMLYTDKTLVNLLNFGEEGKDYTKNSNGSITMTKGSDYAFGQGWMFGNQFNDLVLSTESTTKWADFDTFNSKGKVLPSLGFMYDDKNMTTQEATLGNVIQKYYKQLLAGSVDVDSTVKTMSAALDAGKESDFLADIQTQYDAFLKAKS